MNRTLTNMLSHFVKFQGNDWDEFLSHSSYAYNSTYNPLIKASPFFMFFGRQPPSLASALLSVEMHSDLSRKMKDALRATF
jgi:hypothetical protein